MECNNKHEDMILFEAASGYVFTKENTATRKTQHVEMRYLFMDIMSGRYTYQLIGDMIGKDRASIYHGIKRFNILCSVDKEYKRKCDIIKNKYRRLQSKNYE